MPLLDYLINTWLITCVRYIEKVHTGFSFEVSVYHSGEGGAGVAGWISRVPEMQIGAKGRMNSTAEPRWSKASCCPCEVPIGDVSLMDTLGQLDGTRPGDFLSFLNYLKPQSEGVVNF